MIFTTLVIAYCSQVFYILIFYFYNFPDLSAFSMELTESKEELEERLHFQKVLNAFRSYKKHAIASIHKREDYLNRLPMEHQKLLRKHGYQETMDDLKLAVDRNWIIINHILKDVDAIFQNVNHADKAEEDPRVRPTPVDMDKIQSTLKQIGEITFNWFYVLSRSEGLVQ